MTKYDTSYVEVVSSISIKHVFIVYGNFKSNVIFVANTYASCASSGIIIVKGV